MFLVEKWWAVMMRASNPEKCGAPKGSVGANNSNNYGL